MEGNEELDTLTNTVKRILQTDERARNSDHWLIIEVLREMGFKIFIDYHEIDKMPSFESVSRCRRKLQENNEDLKASTKVEAYRKERQSLMQTMNLEQPSRSTVVTSNHIRPRQTVEVPERRF